MIPRTLPEVLAQVSLKESGKSRADLWQLAANTAIDIAVADANLACDDLGFLQLLIIELSIGMEVLYDFLVKLHLI